MKGVSDAPIQANQKKKRGTMNKHCFTLYHVLHSDESDQEIIGEQTEDGSLLVYTGEGYDAIELSPRDALDLAIKLEAWANGEFGATAAVVKEEEMATIVQAFCTTTGRDVLDCDCERCTGVRDGLASIKDEDCPHSCPCCELNQQRINELRGRIQQAATLLDSYDLMLTLMREYVSAYSFMDDVWVDTQLDRIAAWKEGR